MQPTGNQLTPDDFPRPLFTRQPDLRPAREWRWEESHLNVDTDESKIDPSERREWIQYLQQVLPECITTLEKWGAEGYDGFARHLSPSARLFALYQADLYRDVLNKYAGGNRTSILFDRQALLLDHPKFSEQTKPLTPQDFELAYRRGLRYRQAKDVYQYQEGARTRYSVPHKGLIEGAAGHYISSQDLDLWVDAWDLGMQGKPMNRFWEKSGQPEVQTETTRPEEPAPVQPEVQPQPADVRPGEVRPEMEPVAQPEVQSVTDEPVPAFVPTHLLRTTVMAEPIEVMIVRETPDVLSIARQMGRRN